MLDNVGTEDLDEEEYDESDYNEELNDSLYDSNFCQVNEILFVQERLSILQNENN
jgi:hypothetical protein